MLKNSDDFSMQEAMRLAKSSAGQQLINYLQNADGETMKKAMDEAASGNFGQAKQTMSTLLSSPEVQKLIKQLGG